MADAQPQSQPEPTPEQVVDAIYAHAAELLRAGTPTKDIEKDLMSRGLDAEAAGIVVRNLKEAFSKAHRDAGKQNMLYGALWCIGGTIVTVVTMAAAAGGGTYVVAWGAIIFGAVQFFRGVSQLGSGD